MAQDSHSADSAADRLAIMERLHRYAWGYDARDLDMLRDSFTADASLSMQLKGSPAWGPYVGREAIVEWMSGFMKVQSDQRRHSMTNFLFDAISSTRAQVRCFMVLTSAENAQVRLLSTGAYHVELKKEDGVWRIFRLALILDAPF